MQVKVPKRPPTPSPHLLYSLGSLTPLKNLLLLPLSLSLSLSLKVRVCVFVRVPLMRERVNTPSPSLFFRFLALLFMALLTFLPAEPSHDTKKRTAAASAKRKKKKQPPPPPEKAPPPPPPTSWYQFKNLLTCKQIPDSKIHDPSKHHYSGSSSSGAYTSCSSICTFRDVAHSNTRVIHRADISPEGSTLGGQETRLLSKKTAHGTPSSSSSRSAASRSVTVSCSAARGIQLRKLSGCYECHAIVDPSRYPFPRTTICACSECGEVFPKLESLEHHQAVRHAVSELGPEDSSRNIVEIIFKSSWLKKDNPICKIERILKVHNTQRTIQRFEDYRDAVKIRSTAAAAGKRSARCAADGNELLRFHCASLTCALGARGASSLCGAIPACGVCTVIRHGFQSARINGIRTTASSGRAHDCLPASAAAGSGSGARRAMLVCRVIAGRVKLPAEDAAAESDGGQYDSVAGCAGAYSNMEELRVFSSRAILPCFVVIYKALES